MSYNAWYGKVSRFILGLVLIAALVPNALPASAQPQEDCGIVDAIDYPIDGISIDHDDFGMYRAGYDGYHAGIDMAFGRFGEPVRAAARGRVTFADPAGWNDEKGVVVVEHNFPDGSIVFTLYGHMEEVNGYFFPRVGSCVTRGQIVGAVGNPKNSAEHLHYEIRTMRSSTGGPGYWDTDPLSGGWMHPIEFTERWRLRFMPSTRSLLVSASPFTAPPIPTPDGGVVFSSLYQIEARNALNQPLWQLGVQRLAGAVQMPDGRILGRAAANQIIIFENGRFAASWTADRDLRSGPLLVDGALIFLTTDHRAVSYNADGTPRWATEPISSYIESYTVSGGLLALAGARDGANRLWVLNTDGKFVYEGAAPAPVVPQPSPFGVLILAGSQISLLTFDGQLLGALDTGQALGRTSRAAIDHQGNLYVYPGQGSFIYAYEPNGGLRWQTRLATLPIQPPMIAVGAGCLVYALSDTGALFAYRATDGSLLGTAALYAGGPNRRESGRLLEVLPSEQVRFSAGYLGLATVDGLALAGLERCE